MQHIKIGINGCFEGQVVEKKNGVVIREESYHVDFAPQYDFCKKKTDAVEIEFKNIKSDNLKIVIAVEPRKEDLLLR